MEEKYIIEEYLDGNLNGLRLELFKINLKSNKEFRKKVNIYKDIDRVMKVHLMVADAELEMRNKNIDKLAACNGPFSLQARLYWPDPDMPDPLYVMPTVTKAK